MRSAASAASSSWVRAVSHSKASRGWSHGSAPLTTLEKSFGLRAEGGRSTQTQSLPTLPETRLSERERDDQHSAIATTGNSRPFEAWTVMIWTSPSAPPASEAGETLETSSQRSNSWAARAGPIERSSVSSRM